MELMISGKISGFEISGKWAALVLDTSNSEALPDETWSLKIILKDSVALRAKNELKQGDDVFVVCAKLKFDFGRKVMKVFANDFAKHEEE